MGNTAKIKNEILKDVNSLLGERDESIRQGFQQMEQNMRQAVGMLEFRSAVAFAALEEMGVPKAKIEEIAANIQKQAQEAQQPGGTVNEPYSGGDAPTEGVENPEQQEASPSEGGDEHFE